MDEPGANASKDLPAIFEDAYSKFLDCAGVIFSSGCPEEARKNSRARLKTKL